jgi:hypothetical protein
LASVTFAASALARKPGTPSSGCGKTLPNLYFDHARDVLR